MHFFSKKPERSKVRDIQTRLKVLKLPSLHNYDLPRLRGSIAIPQLFLLTFSLSVPILIFYKHLMNKRSFDSYSGWSLDKGNHVYNQSEGGYILKPFPKLINLVNLHHSSHQKFVAVIVFLP
jgi:hypothetical protein